GTEDYSHLLVLWWPDRNEPRRTGGVKVRPMGRQDLPEVGIFATRSPVRPNPILATVVEVVARHGTTLEVTGLDAIDGTPVVDIKPLTPSDCPTGGMRVPEWLARVHRELAELDES
ncbi:MAG: SAM-dependent methyltransferase, partial [Thermoleophilia bacterium]|nr:SAM-dependent methyltransferase [Thermoleophilia bacterium]